MAFAIPDPLENPPKPRRGRRPKSPEDKRDFFLKIACTERELQDYQVEATRRQMPMAAFVRACVSAALDYGFPEEVRK